MEKQCVNCKYARAKPTRNCACNNKVKYPIVDIVEFKYNGAGMPYCDGFKKAYKVSK